jgi:hypothetical protein
MLCIVFAVSQVTIVSSITTRDGKGRFVITVPNIAEGTQMFLTELDSTQEASPPIGWEIVGAMILVTFEPPEISKDIDVIQLTYSEDFQISPSRRYHPTQS